MVEDKVKEVIVDVLCCEESELRPEAKLIDDMGADSLDIVSISMQLEDEYNLEIEDEDLMALITVDDVVKYIKTRLN